MFQNISRASLLEIFLKPAGSWLPHPHETLLTAGTGLVSLLALFALPTAGVCFPFLLFWAFLGPAAFPAMLGESFLYIFLTKQGFVLSLDGTCLASSKLESARCHRAFANFGF